nr:Otopetrin domain containing protein [Haemonchus contortus]
MYNVKLALDDEKVCYDECHPLVVCRVGMFTALTAFYSLFLTIFALVLELSHLLSGEEQREISTKDMIFGMYMYGASILFFVYMYVVLLLDPRWYWTIDVIKRCVNQSKSSDSSISSAVATVRKVTHSGSSAGSLFLRLGCVVFGVTGVVYYAFLVFLCSSDTNCSSWSTALDVCAIVFIFTQMHFIFCNSKLSITGHHTAARLGTMHLMAANLWTWIRYVLMEEGVMEKEIR